MNKSKSSLKWIRPMVGIGVDSMRLTDVPVPADVNADEVLLRVLAVSINFRDYAMASSSLVPADDNICPVSDCVGEVIIAGEDTGLHIGDRVCPLLVPGFTEGRDRSGPRRVSHSITRDGFAQEYTVIRGVDCFRVPQFLSDAEASTLPSAALTAWNAVRDSSPQVGKGDTVLVQGTGGVATFAAQFARALGCRVMATSSSDQKLKRLEQNRILVSAEVDGINYSSHVNWEEEVLKRTGKQGVDLIIDVGGSGTIPKSMKAAARMGVVASVDTLDHRTDVPGLDSMEIFRKALTIRGVSSGSKNQFAEMVSFMNLHKIRPIIDERFVYQGIREVPRAIEQISKGQHFGKIVVTFV